MWLEWYSRHIDGGAIKAGAVGHAVSSKRFQAFHEVSVSTSQAVVGSLAKTLVQVLCRA